MIDQQKFPDYWVNLLETSEKQYYISDLKKGSEYDRIEKDFKKTMNSNYSITKIQLIQDVKKWSIYMNGLEQTRLKPTPDNEKHLWHGTSSLDPSVIYAQ